MSLKSDGQYLRFKIVPNGDVRSRVLCSDGGIRHHCRLVFASSL
jgi:hypothetical protein